MERSTNDVADRTRLLVEENVKRHDRVADSYNEQHPEIHNPTEQRRLRETLKKAVQLVGTESRRALDFGAGTGNLTAKLLGLGLEVCAADVSAGMLGVLARHHRGAVEEGRLRTQVLDGTFPLPFRDGEFAFVGSYSVLHHVPDYLAAVRELSRVVAPGGILFIDHEHSADHWRSPVGVRVHRALCNPGYVFKRLLARGAAPLGHPEPELPPPGEREICEEWDIHIHADDCIEWPLVRREATAGGLQELPFPEYLLCQERSAFPIRHMICRRFATDMGIYVGSRPLPPAS